MVIIEQDIFEWEKWYLPRTGMSVEKFNVISCFHYDKCLCNSKKSINTEYIYRNIFAKYSIGNRFNRQESVTNF